MNRLIYPFSTTFLDYPDNESLAIIIYFCGCEHNCKNCQSPDLQSFLYEDNTILVDINNFDNIIKNIKDTCTKNRTNKIVLSGGDCLHPFNLCLTRNMLKSLKDYEICIYTGYDKEYVQKLELNNFKYIKCGKYEESIKQISEKTDDFFKFASKNQELINSEFKVLSKNGIYYFTK